VTLPGRVATATIAGTDPPLTVVGVYVPSSDRAPDKIARKRDFITSLLTALRGFPEQVRARLVLGGDYNVITRDHLPPYRGFLPFEYGMLDALHDLGLVDAHEHCAPGAQAHSWIGRSGNGYRFDYVHIAAPLTDRLVDVRYVHDPRERQLTDHAAVTVSLCVPVGARLPVDPAGLVSTGLLF
jgi:exonuclease III